MNWMDNGVNNNEPSNVIVGEQVLNIPKSVQCVSDIAEWVRHRMMRS